MKTKSLTAILTCPALVFIIFFKTTLYAQVESSKEISEPPFEIRIDAGINTAHSFEKFYKVGLNIKILKKLYGQIDLYNFYNRKMKHIGYGIYPGVNYRLVNSEKSNLDVNVVVAFDSESAGTLTGAKYTYLFGKHYGLSAGALFPVFTGNVYNPFISIGLMVK
jgi:hypothetical protein